MRTKRIRYLLLAFAAVFLANNAWASVRACIVHAAVHEPAAMRSLDSSGGERLCSESPVAPDCPAHYAQNLTASGDQSLYLGASAIAVAPPLAAYRVRLPAEPRRLLAASVPPVVGPPLTILFLNLRN